MKKNPKLLVVSLLVFALLFSIIPSVPASAASKRYFSDVKKSYKYREDIEWLANHGAYKSIASKGKKFQPTKNLTRKEFGKILKNLYGKRIDITIKGPKTIVTQKYMTNMLTKVSKQLGYRVTWKNSSSTKKVSRALASHYIKSMIVKSSKLSVDDPTGTASISSLANYIHDGVFDIADYGWDVGASGWYVGDQDFLIYYTSGNWYVQMGVNPNHPGKTFIVVGSWDPSRTDRYNYATYSYTFKTGKTMKTSAGDISIEALSHLSDLIEAMKKNPNPNIPPNIKGATFKQCRFDDAFKQP